MESELAVRIGDLPSGDRPRERLARSGAEPVVTVEATIVTSVSSRSFVLGVICQGAGTNACLPSIEQLTLTLSGPGGTLGALEAGDLTPIVDVTGLAPGTYTISLLIPALPAGVEILQVAPGSITVRVVAPATPAPTPAP